MTETQPTDLVRKGNDLLEARYRLGVMEQKVIIFVASKIKKNDPPGTTYKIGIKEFCKVVGLKGNSAYSELRKTTLGLMSKPIELRNGNRVIQTNWITTVVYYESEGCVELGIAKNLHEFFFELQRNFTTYQLQNVISLKKKFSIRIYELLKRYEGFRSDKTYTVEELRSMLGIEEDEYPLYGDFKKRVLISSQKELENKTDISFDFEEIKTGRKVTSVRIIIKSKNKEQPKQVLSVEEKTNLDIVRDALNKNEINIPKQYIVELSKIDVNDAVKFIEHTKHNKSIESPEAYIIWAINKKTISEVVSSIKPKAVKPEWMDKDSEETVNKVALNSPIDEDFEREKEKLAAELQELGPKKTIY